MSADHVDVDKLDLVDGPEELPWSFDRRRFVGMLTAGAGAVAAGSFAPTARAETASPYAIGTMARDGITDPVEFAVEELVELFRTRKLSPTEVTQAYIDRIKAYDPGFYKAYNAFVPELALEKAKALEKSRARTPLWGVPYAPKDNFYTKGILTTANSYLYEDFVPDYDSTYTARLDAAGAVLLGKTAMGPLASGRATTPNGIVTTRSAWTPNDDRTSPSGSSAGSGCATAARLAAFTLGTQTGGSITSPTQAGGLTGLKPTLGRTSVWGVIPLSLTRDHTGPMCRTVKDVAYTLGPASGPDVNDPRTIGVPPLGDVLRDATPVRRWNGPILRYRTRIGVPPGFADGSTPTAAARTALLDTLKSLGATLVEVPTPASVTEYAARAATNGESSEMFREFLRGDLTKFGGRLTGFVSGLMRGADHYISARRANVLLVEAILDEVFDKCDVILAPPQFDAAGFPMLAFPIGFQTNEFGFEVPIGVILGGRPYDEGRLLSVVAGFQAKTDFHLKRPPEPVVTPAPAPARTDNARIGVLSSAAPTQLTPEEIYETELTGLES